MGLIGFVFEIVVLACIAGGIASNGAVVGTCDMLQLGRNVGHIGPWRADIAGSGCVGWEKDDVDEADWLINMAGSSLQHDGLGVWVHFGSVWLFQPVPVCLALLATHYGFVRRRRPDRLGLDVANDSEQRVR